MKDYSCVLCRTEQDVVLFTTSISESFEQQLEEHHLPSDLKGSIAHSDTVQLKGREGRAPEADSDSDYSDSVIFFKKDPVTFDNEARIWAPNEFMSSVFSTLLSFHCPACSMVL